MSKNQVSPSDLSATEKQFLLAAIPSFEKRRIMVVGDVGLDEYILGEVKRISPEAPVPVLEVESEDFRLGLAGNVAQNIQSLGGHAVLVSVVGRDAGFESLTQLFQKAGVSAEHLVVDSSRPTTRKSRIMAKHHHLVRVDYETRKFISADTEKRVFEMIQTQIKNVDAVIIEDYAKGAITPTLIKKIIELGKASGKPVMVDPHRSNHAEFYFGVDLIKPNFDEAIALSGLNYDEMRDHPNKVIEVGRELQKKTGAKQVVLTQGKDGMSIFSGDAIAKVPTYARQVFDVTGAGDTVIAALSLALSSGLSLEQSCRMANFAAGVVVGQVGCVPCTVQELKDYIEEM